jgi:hypothetical protein
VLWRDPGQHGQLLGVAFELLSWHGLQLVARGRTPLDAELVGDRLGGADVVAGDHVHRDPGTGAGGDGLLGLGPGRVDDPDQGQQGQLLEGAEQVGRRVEAVRIVVAPGHRHGA